MSSEQLEAIRCAYADLLGAYQAYEQSDMLAHDWKAHRLTLDEMLELFSFLKEETDVQN